MWYTVSVRFIVIFFRKSATKWLLCIEAQGGAIISLYHSNVALFHMSACVRWFIDSSSVSLCDARKLHIYAANPLLFEKNMSGCISSRWVPIYV